MGVHFQKVGVHVTPNSLHLTPYSSPQNSATGRLELPAPGVAREDPRPGLHVSTVHRQPCVNPFQTARTTAPTGLELPLPGPLRRDPPNPDGGSAMAAKAQAGHSRKSRGRALPLGTRCRKPGMHSAKVAPTPAPHGRHGMAAAAGQTRKALAGPLLTSPVRRWQAVSDSTAPCQCRAAWCLRCSALAL